MQVLRILLMLVAFATSSAHAADDFQNGYVDRASDTFVWSNIGGDPLRVSHEAALSQSRVAEVVSAEVRRELIRRMEDARQFAPNHSVQEGDRVDLMLSGDGWIAHNAVAVTSLWRANASRDAWVVYYTNPATGVQYILTYFKECGNLGLTIVGAAKKCRCVPELGDACSFK